MKKIVTFFITLMILVFCVTNLTFAQNYPSDTINIIVPGSAGGGTDVIGRIFATYLAKHLNTEVIVINRPGAGLEIGFTETYNSKPDGYTIGFTNLPTFVSLPLMRNVNFDVDKFIYLVNLVTDPGLIAVKGDDNRFGDLEDLIEYAKENPYQITVGNTGVASDDDLATMSLENQSGVNFIRVPFPGGAPNRNALLGGHVDAIACNASEVIQFVESGQMRVIAVMTEERYADFPEVPTFKELGYDIIFGSSRGLSAPSGVPDEILNILLDGCKKATNDPDFLAQAKKAQQPLNIKFDEDLLKLYEDYKNDVQTLYEKYGW